MIRRSLRYLAIGNGGFLGSALSAVIALFAVLSGEKIPRWEIILFYVCFFVSNICGYFYSRWLTNARNQEKMLLKYAELWRERYQKLLEDIATRKLG